MSVGDAARFLLGGLRRRDPGGRHPARIRRRVLCSAAPRGCGYHGVSRIVPGTAPPDLGIEGRFNLTFRQY